MVRVVSIGVPLKDLLADPANQRWREFSIEFCGGTHLANTADAEAFCLIAEESVSKGIRRIVALTGPSARETAEQGRQLQELVAQATSAADDHLGGLIAAMQKILAAGNLPLLVKRRAQATLNELFTRQKSWEKKNAARSAVDPAIAAGELLAKAADLGPGKLIVGSIAGVTEDQLRASVDWLKKKTPSYAILLGATDGQKVFFVAAVSDDLIAKGLKAGDWVRQAAQAAGGGGGGRPQMAQAGGKDPSKLGEALEIAGKGAKKMMNDE
jgi:alanyl-tRNA synthetase